MSPKEYHEALGHRTVLDVMASVVDDNEAPTKVRAAALRLMIGGDRSEQDFTTVARWRVGQDPVPCRSCDAPPPPYDPNGEDAITPGYES